MNTPMILAAMESPSASPKPGVQPQNSGNESPGPSFSKVLLDQRTTTKSGTGQGARPNTPSGLAAAEASKHDAELLKTDDDAMALLAAESGVSLPQIALHIASAAAPGKEPGLAAAPGIMRGQPRNAGASAQGETHRTAVDPDLTESVRPGGMYDEAGRVASGKIEPPPSATMHQNQASRLKASAQPGSGKGHGERAITRNPAAPSHEAVQNQNAAAAQLNIAQSGFTDPGGKPPADTAVQSATSSIAGASAFGAVATPNNPSFHAGPSAASATVATPLQFAQWGNDFARQFMTLMPSGNTMSHTAELRLDPPELGPIRISIHFHDNVAQASFVSPHAAVRQAVENALPQLQDSLAQAGISLGQTSVSDQQQSREPYSDSSGRSRNGQGRSTHAIGGPEIEIAAHVLTRSRAPDALVDTFA